MTATDTVGEGTATGVGADQGVVDMTTISGSRADQEDTTTMEEVIAEGEAGGAGMMTSEEGEGGGAAGMRMRGGRSLRATLLRGAGEGGRAVITMTMTTLTCGEACLAHVGTRVGGLGTSREGGGPEGGQQGKGGDEEPLSNERS